MKLRLLVAGLSACSTLAIPTTVWAAAQPPCTPATMTPGAASVPANLPGFAYNALTATTNDVHLFATSAARTEVPLTVGPVEGGLLKVAPTGGLVAGTSYELQYSAFCTYGAYPSKPLTFTATAEAPLPAQLGEVTSGPTVVLKDYGTTQYTIAGSYSLAADVKPWLGVYQLLVVLDGKLVDTKVTVDGSGQTAQVVATGWCDGSNAALKKHSIQLRGRLPFARTVETAAAEVTFDCPAPTFSTPPNNGAVPPSGTTSSSGSSGLGGGSSGEPARREASGCSVGATSSSSSFALVTAVAGLFAMLRRRRVSGASAAARRT